MIDNSIRQAFESIDDEASDEFRELLRRRCLAELTAADTRPARAPTDVQFLPAQEMSMSIDSPTPGTKNRRHLLLAAAAVVVVLGVAGVALANRNSDDDQTPSSPAAATIAPTTAVPTSAVVPTTETVSFAVESANGIPVSFTAPTDWTVSDGWAAYKPTPDSLSVVGVNFDQIANIFAEGCQWVQLDPPVGPTVDDLVQAWTGLPQFAATAAVDVTVDGYAGKQIELTAPDYNRLDCKETHYGLWYPGADPQPGDVAPGFWAQAPQSHLQQWILDVDGTRLVISAGFVPSATPQDRADLEAALASIQIG
jgi:hypothetical protein